jgi:hypothetical protein
MALKWSISLVYYLTSALQFKCKQADYKLKLITIFHSQRYSRQKLQVFNFVFGFVQTYATLKRKYLFAKYILSHFFTHFTNMIHFSVKVVWISYKDFSRNNGIYWEETSRWALLVLLSSTHEDEMVIRSCNKNYTSDPVLGSGKTPCAFE